MGTVSHHSKYIYLYLYIQCIGSYSSTVPSFRVRFNRLILETLIYLIYSLII